VTTYTYYPGCSLHATALEYDHSVRAVFYGLGHELVELEDWNCCGATSAHSLRADLALLLPARNLALAAPEGRDLVLPCAACFNRHKTAAHVLQSNGPERMRATHELGESFLLATAVRPLLDVVARDVGTGAVHAVTRRPLNQLPVVSYYGCLLVRPPGIMQFDDPEHPVVRDQLLEAVGAAPQRWEGATECCGGGLSLTRPRSAARLVDRLATQAREAGAQAFVTSCPLCQMNLEMRQSKGKDRLPVFFFTELLGLAMGLAEAESWWSKHLISPRSLLARFALDGGSVRG
jgi:heterodisulfide reductase subunit B